MTAIFKILRGCYVGERSRDKAVFLAGVGRIR